MAFGKRAVGAQVKFYFSLSDCDLEFANRRDYHIQNLFGGLACWDSRHFLHIAEFGYTWENNLAFFPLFPAVLRTLGTAAQYFLGPVSFFSAMTLSGVVLNNVSSQRFS